jgi:two-component system, NarL family, response regulator NreC
METSAIKVRLSPREQQVLNLICHEQSSSEIADSLKIAIGTVYTYRKNLLKKTGSANSIGLIKYALREKIIG